MKKTLLGLIVSLFFLYLVFRQINIDALLSAFRQVNYFIVIGAILFHTIGFWLRTLRWKLLLLRLKRMRVRHLFPYLAMGYMANNILFLRLGEVVRAYIVGQRENLSKSSMLAVILAERLFDGFALVLFFGALVIFLPLPPQLKSPLILASVLFLTATVAFFMLPYLEKINLVKSLFTFLEGRTKLRRPYRILMSFLEGLKTLTGLQSVVEVVVVSVLIWGVEAGMFWIIAQSFHLQIGLGQTAVLALVVGLSTLIPSGPGYVGTFEFFFVTVATYFGVNRDLAISYAFLTHFAQWLPITLVGFYFGWAKGISPLHLKESKQ